MGNYFFGGENNPLKERTADHSGGGESYVLAARQVLHIKYLIKIRNSCRAETGKMLFVRPALSEVEGLPAAKYLPSQTLQCRGGKNGLGTATNPHQNINRRFRETGCERHRNIAIGEKLDAGAGLANLPYELFVARPVKHGYRYPSHVFAKGARDFHNVFFRRR